MKNSSIIRSIEWFIRTRFSSLHAYAIKSVICNL
uniref:Uncharacterized protein n=1 Tax=Arundo donax TaxID=35708 RepID=A0A0A9HKZ7_ARUDO